MTYLLRLILVCVASFFLVHLAVGLVVWCLSPLAVRISVRMRAAAGARLLLSLRLLPLSLSVVVVLGLCIPSYLRYEQDARESIGLACTLLAAVGLVLTTTAVAHFFRAIELSSRFADQANAPAGTSSLFALVGFFRTRIVVSPRIRRTLSEPQMEVALLHEEAHAYAHDNLKRLALVASPGLVPFHNSFRLLETQWARLTEWAADDAAVAAQPLRAIALAEALVRVARLSTRMDTFAAISSLVPSKDDLAERVERLLQPAATTQGRISRSLKAASVLASCLVLTLLVTHQRHLLYSVHRAMENLVR